MSERKFVTYSKEFKEMAVKNYLAGGKSYKTLIEELGIKDTKTLRSWVGKYRQGDPLDEGRGKRPGPQRGRPRTEFASLEEELAYVKAERDYLKKLYRSRFGHEWGAHEKDNASL